MLTRFIHIAYMSYLTYTLAYESERQGRCVAAWGNENTSVFRYSPCRGGPFAKKTTNWREFNHATIQANANNWTEVPRT